MTVPSVLQRPVPTLAMMAVFTVFAAGLIGQPERWLSTPAYGNLMVTMPPGYWGVAYLVAVVSLGMTLVLRKNHVTAAVTHMWPVILMLWWEIAFIVRWVTDAKTTIANVVAWGVYLSLVLWSTTLNDRPKRARE